MNAPAAPPAPDAATLAWLARRGLSAQWRDFLPALAEILTASMGAAARDDVMRRVGARMAQHRPVPRVGTLGDLEAGVNAALASMDWGYATFLLDTGENALVIQHWAAPVVTAPGDPDGEWIGPVLEGLHGAWLAAQADGPGAVLRRVSTQPGQVVLRTVPG